MVRRSAGILLHRSRDGNVEVLLVHPGGPFFANKDNGVWSIAKGEFEPGEDALGAARREFAEELGSPAPDGEALDLGEVRQKSGKYVRGFALAGDLDAAAIVSNLCTVQWPPRSGRTIQVPEVDRAEWVGLAEAAERMIPAQAAFLERLTEALT